MFTLPTQVYLILGLTYFILCFGLSRFAFWLERRQAAAWQSQGGPMIRLEKVNKWYGAYHALADVDEQVGRGEVVVVCGPSGSGKSTLIRTLNRLEPIQGGRILIDGQDIHAPGLDLNRFRSHIGFVFQQFNLFPHLNVLDNCTLAPLRLRGLKPAEARRQAMALLERVGLADKAAAFPRGFPAASSSAWRSPARWRWSRR